MVETPRPLQAFQHRPEGNVVRSTMGRSKAKAARPDSSTTLEGRELLAHVRAEAKALVEACKADSAEGDALLKRIGAPPLKPLR